MVATCPSLRRPRRTVRWRSTAMAVRWRSLPGIEPVARCEAAPRCLGDGEVCSTIKPSCAGRGTKPRPASCRVAGRACRRLGSAELAGGSRRLAAAMPARRAGHPRACGVQPNVVLLRLRLPESWEAYEALLSKSHASRFAACAARVGGPIGRGCTRRRSEPPTAASPCWSNCTAAAEAQGLPGRLPRRGSWRFTAR